MVMQRTLTPLCEGSIPSALVRRILPQSWAV